MRGPSSAEIFLQFRKQIQHPRISHHTIHSSYFLTIWVAFVHKGDVEKLSEKATLEDTLVAFVLCFLQQNPLF